MAEDITHLEKVMNTCQVCKKNTALLPLDDKVYICECCAQIMAELSPS